MDRATVVARAARDLRARSPLPSVAPSNSSHPIEDLCARLALTVAPAPQDGAMLGGAHARLQLWRWDYPEQGGVVWVRDDLSAAARAFAIAHELGHLILHRGEGATFHSTCAPSLVSEQVDAEDLRREVRGVEEYTPRARRELEANAFAAELLAPAAAVRALFAASPTCDLDTIAQAFGISIALARQRLLAAVFAAPDEDATVAAPSRSTEPPHATRDPRELLERLDASQREAARMTGPALIVAGPGTGKTATLVGRVAHLISERGRQPERVLALTFSNRAAGEMRQRLAESGLPAERIPVLTIHAFATTLLREYAARAPHAPDEPPLAPDFRILDETDGFLLAEDLLAEFPLRYYRSFGNPTAHLATLLQDFGRARDALWTPDMYLARASAMPTSHHDEPVAAESGEAAEFDDERAGSAAADGQAARMGASTAVGQRARACERARAYAVWDRTLRRAGLLDFGGLIQRAVELLVADELVLRDVRARYRDVLVDEFQDTNIAAAELLLLLAGADGRGLWVVGDHRQAIYRWRGAAPSNMYRLADQYPDLRVHSLRVSYRSVPALLDLGHAMATRMATARAGILPGETGDRSSAIDAAAAGQRLTAVRAPTAHAPVLYSPDYATAAEECAGVVAAIQAHRGFGYAYADQAVLCRSHKQVRRFTASMSDAGVPSVQVGGFFERPEIKDGLALLALAAGPDARGLLRAPQLLAALGQRMPDAAEWTRAVLTIFVDARPAPACLTTAHQPDGASAAHSAGFARASAVIGMLGHIATDMRYRTSVAESLTRFFLRPGGYAWRLLQRASAPNDAGAGTVDRGYAATALAALGEFIHIATRFDLRWNTDSAFRERLGRSVRHGTHAEPRGDATPDEAAKTAAHDPSAGQAPRDALPVACFLRYFDALQATGADIVLPAGSDDAVRVMTIHASKGLEFPVVFLPALANGQFPSVASREDAPVPGLREDGSPAQRLAEEQCLFYVGVTRARDVVAISRAASYSESGATARASDLLALAQDAAPFQAAPPFPGVPALVAGARVAERDDGQLGDDTSFCDEAATRDGPRVATKRRFRYDELDQYGRCPRKYKYMRVLGLWDSSENAMLRFHRYIRQGARILRQRAATAPVPDWTTLARELDAEWEAIGPVGHAYEAFYHRGALDMLRREWAEMSASAAGPLGADVALPLEAELRDCVVAVEADRMVYDADSVERPGRPVTLIRQHTGTPAKAHEDDLRLPLYAIACRQREPDTQARIELRYRGDALREPDDGPTPPTTYTVDVTAKARHLADAYLRPGRKQRSVLDKLDEAAAGIAAGRFPPKPDEHRCAHCSFHAICPADLALTD